MPKTTFYFVCGLVCLMGLYCVYNFYFIDSFASDISVKARHVLKFLFIILSYLIGWVTLRKQPPAWKIRIWHLLYGIGLVCLVLLGIYDWAVRRASLDMRVIAYDIQELLVSPILYVAIGLVGKLNVVRGKG
jgi:hypothetical protein